MLHIAEISCTPASLNFIQTRDSNTSCRASRTAEFVADENECEAAKYGEENVESGARNWGHESSSSPDKDEVLTEKDGTKRSSIYLC